MSLYIGKNSSTAVDLIANKDNENLIKALIKQYYLPAIGSVKFLARSSKHSIPGIFSSPDGVYHRNPGQIFNGWVFADGSKFSKVDFRDGFTVFGDKFGADSTSFNVPNLYSFYKIDNTLETGIIQNANEQPCKTLSVDHSHNINADIKYNNSGNIKNSISCVTTPDTFNEGSLINRDDKKTLSGQVGGTYPEHGGLSSGGDIPLTSLTEPTGAYYNAIPAFHNGKGDYEVFTAPLTINMDADFSEVEVNYDGKDSPNCYPLHLTLIPMIYIGASI